MEGIFIMEDWQNFGEDYDKTLMAWYENFRQAWPDLRDRYGERFFRMWEFYLLSSAGGFRSRSMQLWQIIMTPPGTTWEGRTRSKKIGPEKTPAQKTRAQ
jgi:cyclopropane-fatty-acyl-phospholipid synthase